jgi:magnesium-transporting ATPase (P-type)|tara:strand:- start:1216 stop:1404 length:189 start_codon:yes stop_codon:yes gene_type:complete
MNSIKNILLVFGVMGVLVFILNDFVYYMTDANQTFLEHIIIGWLVVISTTLTFILFYKEKKK